MITNLSSRIRRYRLLIFSIFCFQFLILFYTQFLSPEWLQSIVDENMMKQKKFILEGSISMVSEKNATSGLTNIEMALNGEHFPSIIITDSNGRLGNQLCAYSTLLYFQKVHGMHAILNEWQMNMLGSVFKQEKLEITPSRIDLPPQFAINWEGVASPTPQGAWFPNDQFLANIEEYKYNKFLNIGMYPHYLFLFKEILDHIKKHLMFKQDIQVMVDQTLAEIKVEKSSEKEIIFIGVHCRRTDYGSHLQSLAGATLVDHNYFDRAFEIYRSRYNNDNTEIIFLAVSDDQAWIKENLGKYSDVRFGLDFSQGKINDTDMPGFDLCLLAACNHSIHTYGTFGMWGSLLAGGDVITTTGTNPDATTEEDQIYRRAAMTGWVYLDVRDLNNIQEVTYTPQM